MFQSNDFVTIIVRTSQEKRLPLLNKALLSIVANDYRPIEIIIVAQSEQQNFIDYLQNICKQFTVDQIQVKLIINYTSKDERAKNLNLGINAANGRYIGFLDDDDIFYSNHISKLVNILNSENIFSWAFSDVKLALVSLHQDKINYIGCDYRFSQNIFSLKDLFKNNFILIHSYLIDTNRIDPKFLNFDESFTVGEDYHFILNLAKHYQPYYLKEVTCEYRIFEDLSNSNILMNEIQKHPDKDKIREWSKALWRIEKLKKKLMPEYSSEWISLELRKYIFYKFPELKILLQYKMPKFRKLLISLLRLKI